MHGFAEEVAVMNAVARMARVTEMARVVGVVRWWWWETETGTPTGAPGVP